MTSDQFRKTPEFTSRMSAILDDPVMQQAMIILKESDTVEDVDNDLWPEIASVRKLSRIAGGQEKVQQLIELSIPFIETPPLGEPDFGVLLEPETQ